jgi:diacylglycerol kinase family enzyme
MNAVRSLWLVTNPASGSNDVDTAEQLRLCCDNARLAVDRVIHFPDDALPSRAEMDQVGIDLVAVFAGDGTINALATSLYGWDGMILILPGGTQNLLYHRLHGERDMQDVLEQVARGRARRCRPSIIRCEQGDGLAGIMAGPGTAWNDVREAIREADIAAIASSAANAIEQSVSAPAIICRNPALGRDEGYPLIELTPEEGGFAIDAYHSETVDEYLAQGLALVMRNFRQGPKDRLGQATQLTVEVPSGGKIDLLIDGEPAEAGSRVQFQLVACEVDLLATGFDD